jgi:ribosome-associated heat shock protein Hsp15
MTIELRLPAITRSVRVLATPETRVGAKLTEKFYADITTQEERERAARIRQENRMNRVFDVPGQGRPDKQQQRKIRKFLEKQDNPDC